MWDLPGPGLEPMSPALAGGFLTTAPPGKSRELCFIRREFLGLQAQEAASQVTLRELLQGGESGS